MIVQGSRRRRLQRFGGRMLHWILFEGGVGMRSMSMNQRSVLYRYWNGGTADSRRGSLTEKDKSDEDDNAYLHGKQIKNEMAQIVVAHAIVDPWTMAVGNQLPT